MSGLIVAPIQGMERLAIAISYGPFTRGRTLVMAANRVLPPHATVKCIKPGGESDGWDGMVRDFEAMNAVWGALAGPVGTTGPMSITICTYTGKKVRTHQQRDRSVE